MCKEVAYLGPQGSFCEEAALSLAIGELQPRPSIAAVMEAVARGEVEAGVVPVENSWEGAVHQTMDLLAAGDNLMIAGELVLPIQHHLAARSFWRPEEITRVLSHPQALAQCYSYLTSVCPQAEEMEVASTALGAVIVADNEEPWAAIASKAAADRYNLTIIAADISDMANNETRFLVLKRQDNPVSTNPKTSIVVQAVDKPGALYQLLHEFYIRDISLTRIESRPARTRLGEYRFFIDCLGSRTDEPLAAALEALKDNSVYLKVLGSYSQVKGA